jgi:hypothetical protein
VELAGLMEEFAKIYPMVQDKEKKQRFFKELMKLALKMYGKIYDIMQKRISPSLATLFCIDMITVECTDWKPHSPSLWHQLCSSYQATESADAYGLSLTRTRVDLLTAIQHLVHQVKISCEKDSDLLSFFI